jgi:hypothetical protein
MWKPFPLEETMRLVSTILIILLVMMPVLVAETGVPAWDSARAEILDILTDRGHTEADLAQPKWLETGNFQQPNFYETGYLAIGRMPMVDLSLNEPLSLPAIAEWADARAKAVDGSLFDQLVFAGELSETVKYAGPTREEILTTVRTSDAITVDVAKWLATAEVPVADAITLLIRGTDLANQANARAFATLTSDEYSLLMQILPHYLLPIRQGKETFRCFTVMEVEECADVWRIGQKVNLASLIEAARIQTAVTDEVVRVLGATDLEGVGEGVILDRVFSWGRVVVAGTGADQHTGDATVLVDLGGNDTYTNNAGSCMPGKAGSAVCIDVAGNDTYSGGRFVQGCGYGGIGILVDLDGNDRYIAEDYAQASALFGYGFLVDHCGDDTYTANLGVQGFGLYGAGVLEDRSGTDTYTAAALAQGASTTLGVGVMIEGGGDDRYKTGEKYGFYNKRDGGCAQGSSTGMRVFPLDSGYSVYGGVGFLSEHSGNDVYDGASFAYGGGYVLAFGMMVDSAGNDSYEGDDYINGSGCHLASGVFLDRAGNDTYTHTGHSLGASLDRSVGVMIEQAGSDTYYGNDAVAYAVKPNGLAVFVDGEGKDIYHAQWQSNGYARPSYEPDAPSTSFFFDYGGADTYRNTLARNSGTWGQDWRGVGADRKARPEAEAAPTWAPTEEGTPSTGERIAMLGNWVKAFRADPENALKTIEEWMSTATNLSLSTLKDLLITLYVDQIALDHQDEFVRILLKSGREEAQLIALWGVRWLRIDPGSDALLAACDDGNSVEVRGLGILGLGKHRHGGTVETIAKFLGEDPIEAIRRSAAKALAHFNTPASRKGLESALADQDAATRCFAVRGLRAIEDPASVDALVQATLDEEAFVRMAAARALVLTFGDARGMVPLIDLMDWKNGVMVKERVKPVIRLVTGQKPENSEELRAWWNENKDSIDFASVARSASLRAECEHLIRDAKYDDALVHLRKTLTDSRLAGWGRGKLRELLLARCWETIQKNTEFERSLAESAELLELARDFATLDTRAIFLYRTGKTEEALKLLDEAIGAAPPQHHPMLKQRRQAMEQGTFPEAR